MVLVTQVMTDYPSAPLWSVQIISLCSQFVALFLEDKDKAGSNKLDQTHLATFIFK